MSKISAKNYFDANHNNAFQLMKNFHGVLNDEMIGFLCKKSEPLIDPYFDYQIKEEISDSENVNHLTHTKKLISYGQSSHGYDIRCANEFKIFSNTNTIGIDPKKINENIFIEKDGSKEEIWIPPNSYALTRSIERFNLPPDIVGVAVGKSTYARAGIIINVTPLEAGWEGYLTIEIANGTTLPAKIYPGEGIAQIIFHKSAVCKISYADRNGKYNNQPAQVVLAKV